MSLVAEDITSSIINAAIEVHKVLGPGFMEVIYEEALCVEFRIRGIHFDRQKSFEVQYRGVRIGEHRLDLVVDVCVVVELKAVSSLDKVHFAQLKSYLRATGLRVGLLLNFNKPKLEIKRFVL